MKRFTRVMVAVLLIALLAIPQPASAASFPRLPLLNAAANGGGRRDIHLGNHGNSIITLEVQLAQETRIMFFDRNYNEVGAATYQATGSLSGGTAWHNTGHYINCYPRVYHVALFLDVDKRAVVYKVNEW